MEMLKINYKILLLLLIILSEQKYVENFKLYSNPLLFLFCLFIYSTQSCLRLRRLNVNINLFALNKLTACIVFTNHHARL